MSLEEANRSPAARSPVQSRAVGVADRTALDLSQHLPLEESRMPSYRTQHSAMTPLSLSVDLEDLNSHPIHKPGKNSSQGISYRPISLLCPAPKVLEALILPSISKFLSPAKDQHNFKHRDRLQPAETTSPYMVVTDLTAAFDTVSHDTLISKIAGSSLLPAITRWMSCYL